MRRVMAKIHVFFVFLWFCTYSWPYPSYLASPVLVNPSKLIFLIITNIQNLYITFHPPIPQRHHVEFVAVSLGDGGGGGGGGVM